MITCITTYDGSGIECLKNNFSQWPSNRFGRDILNTMDDGKVLGQQS